MGVEVNEQTYPVFYDTTTTNMQWWYYWEKMCEHKWGFVPGIPGVPVQRPFVPASKFRKEPVDFKPYVDRYIIEKLQSTCPHLTMDEILSRIPTTLPPDDNKTEEELGFHMGDWVWGPRRELGHLLENWTTKANIFWDLEEEDVQ